MNEAPETTQIDVQLPKPRTRKVLIGVLVAVLVLGTIGVAAAAIANRTAQPQGEATAAVMPSNTMMYFSLNTQASQLPNFTAVADAWKDSKEAKMLSSALELAISQAGLNWQDDVQPWLGERVAVGLVDVGNPAATYTMTERIPFFVIAAQTKDRVKSDAALGAMLKQITQASGDTLTSETYRGIPITYLSPSGSSTAEAAALTTINDVVVLTMGSDHMHALVDVALGGQNLASNPNYKTVLSNLPNQNAATGYVDYNRYMNMLLELNQSLQSSFDGVTAGLDPQQADQFKQQRDKMKAQREAEMAQLRDMMKALGGAGAALSYEPTGIRLDMAVQFDPAQMTATQRQIYESALIPASGKLFAALPASTLLAADFNLKGGVLKTMLNPDILAVQFSSLGVSKDDITAKLNEFQTATGLNLQTDLIDLLNGDAGLGVMLRDQQKTDGMSYSSPLELALLFDSSDVNQLAGNFDKLLQSLSKLSPNGGVKTQSLSGLPYSVLLLDDKPLLTYGVVDGRFVIGTDSNTLLGIDHADPSSLANDATFKQATGLLPGDRLSTGYLNLQPLWNLINTQMKGTTDTSASTAAVLNYLAHFKWMSTGSEAPANGLTHGALHIGVGQ